MTDLSTLFILPAFIVGPCLGSFANMLIFRLPHRISLLKARSVCPRCNHPLRIRNLIPIVSFVIQQGTCSFCNKSIALRYLIVELLTTLLCLGYVLPQSPIYFNHHLMIFSYVSLILFFTDIETFVLPLSLNILLIILGLYVSISTASLLTALMSLYIVFALILIRQLFNSIYKVDTFGLGDIIFVAAIGLNWGWLICLGSLYAAILTGGIFCLGLILSKKGGRLDHIAFGPFLIIGFWTAYIGSDYLESLLLF